MLCTGEWCRTKPQGCGMRTPRWPLLAASGNDGCPQHPHCRSAQVAESSRTWFPTGVSERISTHHKPTPWRQSRDEPLFVEPEQSRPVPAAQGQGSHRAPDTARKLLTQRSAFIETMMQRNEIINQLRCFSHGALLGVGMVFHVFFPPWSLGVRDEHRHSNLPPTAVMCAGGCKQC